MEKIQSITPSNELPFKLNLMDTVQLAELLRNKVNTVEGWRLKGVGPRFIRVGRLVRYRLEDVETWLDAQTCSSTSQTGA